MARRLLLFSLLFCLLGATGWAAFYARKAGFTDSWRRLIEDEFAKRDYHAEVGRLTLDPLRGLVARNVRFFSGPDRKTRIAYIDEVMLDVNLSEVLDKKLTLNTLDFNEADISLPVDPEDKKSPNLKISRFSARVVFGDQDIEIVRAQGEIQGIQVSVTGNLFRGALEEVVENATAGSETSKDGSGAKKAEKGKDKEAKSREPGLDLLRDRRVLISRILEEIDGLEFPEGSDPRLSLEVQGDASDMSRLRLSAELRTGAIRRGAYRCESLSADLDYDGRRATLRHFSLRDAKGELRLRADWQTDQKTIPFEATSSLDLLSLAQAFYPMPALGEIVFFDPPRITVQGTWYLDRPLEISSLPVEVVGHFDCDRFGSRGAIFDSLSSDFSVAGDRYYLRNLLLTHKTGMAQAHAIFEPDKGLRYRGEVKLDPGIFSPFFRQEDTRRFLSRFQFDRDSTIYLGFEGSGPELNPKTWASQAAVDLRQFRMNGAKVDRFQAELELNDQQQIFRNLQLLQGEGQASVPLITRQHATRRYEITDATWTLDLVEGMRCFNPKLAEKLKRYRFEQPPTVKLSGVLDGRKREQLAPEEARFSDLEITFTSEGAAQYDFLGETLAFRRPKGRLDLVGDGLHLKDFYADFYGGKLALAFSSDDLRREKRFRTEIQLTNVDYGSLAQIYHAPNKTQGTFGATSSLTGTLGDLRSLKGNVRAQLKDGDIFAVPVFGPLSELIEDVFNRDRAGYSVAREASADLVFEDGYLRTENFEALTDGFLFEANGEVDLINKTVDLETTFNTRLGLTRLILSPVSKLLKYHGEGPVSAPRWRPKLLPKLPGGASDGANARDQGRP